MATQKFDADPASGRIHLNSTDGDRSLYGTAIDKAEAPRIAGILCRAYRANNEGHYTASARLYAQAEAMVRLSKAFAS